LPKSTLKWRELSYARRWFGQAAGGDVGGLRKSHWNWAHAPKAGLWDSHSKAKATSALALVSEPLRGKRLNGFIREFLGWSHG
jgi:hypothetical protein